MDGWSAEIKLLMEEENTQYGFHYVSLRMKGQAKRSDVPQKVNEVISVVQ